MTPAHRLRLVGAGVLAGSCLAAGVSAATGEVASVPVVRGEALTALGTGAADAGLPSVPEPLPPSAAPPVTTAPSVPPPATTTTAPPPPSTTTSKPSAPKPAASVADRVVALVNAERAKAGCAPVRADQRLTTAAQRHSEEMAETGRLSHDSADGRSFAERILAVGYPKPAAENVAKGQRGPEQVMGSWMASAGHRANILNCKLTAIGVAVVQEGWYWTQDFGY